MSPAARQLRARNHLAALPAKDRDRCSWLVNAGIEDTRRGLSEMTGTPAEIRILEVAIDLESAGTNRKSRLDPIAAKLRKFTRMHSDPSPTEVLAPESLLDGTPSTALSPAEARQLAAVDTAWQDAARLAGLVKNYSRATTAAKTLCGIRLRALREHYFGPRNPNGGRPKKTRNVSGFESWGSLITDKLGVEERTAENWMKMADAVEALAEAKGLDLQSICEKLPWDWTPEETAALDATVHKLTEDKTQRELLQSDFLATLGYVAPERINSSNNPLGKNGGKKKPAATPQQLLKERQQAARLVFLGTDKPGRVEQGSVAMFMTRFVNDAGREMEALPQAELRDLYEHTVKPFAAAFRKLAAL